MMKLTWALLMLASAGAGAVLAWLGEGADSPVPGWVAGPLVALAFGAYPAMRLWRLETGDAPASEYLSFQQHGDVVTSRPVPALSIPALVMRGVPPDLGWAARDLIARVVDSRRVEGTVEAGTFRARLVAPNQQVEQAVRLRPDGEALWLTDSTGDACTHLLALHLVCLAEPMVGMRPGEQLLRRSIALLPGQPVTVSGYLTNENNCLAYKLLGDTLWETGRVDEGRAMFDKARSHSPAWARGFAEHVAAEVSAGRLKATDPRAAYWLATLPAAA